MKDRNPWAGAIAAAIEATGKSIPQLASESGLAKSQLYSWSRFDGYKPDKKNLKALAAFLNIAPEKLTVAIVAPEKTAPAAHEWDARELHGRSAEVEALMDYALGRQRILTEALRRVGLQQADALQDTLFATMKSADAVKPAAKRSSGGR